MNEQTNMESAPNEGAGTPSPVSPVSGQPSSAEAAGEVSLQEVLKELKELRKEQQSSKDRAISHLQKQIEELSGKPAEKEPAAAKPDTGTISATQAIPEALARFTEVGLSVSDPDVAALIGKSGEYKTRADFLLEVERTVNRKVIKPPVSPAAVVAPASTPPAQQSGNELIGEYQAKVIAARGNREEIKRLRAAYKEKGVPVEQVSFTIK